MYYVSPTGSDSNAGSKTSPFKSLERAVEETRKQSIAHKKIMLLSGTYPSTYVVLDQRDNGLRIQGDPTGSTVLRGGVQPGSWKESGRGLYCTPLPTGTDPDVRILEINGEFKPRTRFPKTGFATHSSRFAPAWVSTTGGGFETMPTDRERSQLTYAPGVVPEDFTWQDTEITIMHKWDESLVKIKSHDASTRTVNLASMTGNPPGSFGVYEFALWNSAYGMEPGQFRVDKTNRLLYYMPLPWEDMSTASTWLPQQSSIINFAGPVQNISIKDISFMTTASPLVDIIYIREQIPNTYGAIGVTGAIECDGGLKDCVFGNLRFGNIGGWGIRINGKSENIRIEGCSIQNAGAGGIRIEDGEGCTVKGCTIDNTGLVHYSGIGIYVSGCDVIENAVSNTTYTGISYGKGDGGQILRNRVKAAMTVLNDGAGIYVTFCENGTMSGNIVEDVPLGSPSQRHGLYIDEQANGWVVEGNITLNCPSAMLCHMCYREGNIIRNNIFASHAGDIQLSLIRCKNHVLENNTFHAAGKVEFAGNRGAIASFEGNRIYSEAKQVSQMYINDDYSKESPVAIDMTAGNVNPLG